MLHDFVWAIRLDDLNGGLLSKNLRQRVRSASDLLLSLIDDISEGVPRLGAMMDR